MNGRTLHIYDVSGFIYAGTFAKNDFEFPSDSFRFSGNTFGIPVGGIKRLLNEVLTTLADYNNDVVLAFDSKTDKNALFSEYKSNRTKDPKILIQQMILPDVCSRLGLKYAKIDNYEADDIVAQMVKKYGDEIAENYRIITIHTSDSDLAANLVKQDYTIAPPASIYPTITVDSYTAVMKKSGPLIYNTILPYYYFYGKPSNNVKKIVSKHTASTLYTSFLQFCKDNNENQADGSKRELMVKWIAHSIRTSLFTKEDVNYLAERLDIVYPREVDSNLLPEVPNKSKSEINLNELQFFCKMFGLGKLNEMYGLGQMMSTGNMETEMFRYMNPYKEAYESGTFAIDADSTPDSSFFFSESEPIGVQGVEKTEVFSDF